MNSRKASMLFHKFFLASLPMLFLALPSAAQDSVMSAKDIQDSWVGKSVIGTTAAGAAVTLKLQNDGVASVTAGKINDTGTWRLSENGYCATWKVIRAGSERCFTVRKDGAKLTVINPDGSVNSVITEVR
jgi:hypothetical protein